MKTGFYPRLAWDGLRKNRQIARPYLLTCICMVSMFYILSFLTSGEVLALIPSGKNSVELVLSLGRIVILVFSLIFLYYTYSFLLRRRTREFGLYNVLGMGKRNLVRIISWENGITFAAALLGGLLLGILLSKIAELGLVNLMGGAIDYRIRLDGKSLILTVLCYAAVFAVIWLSAVIRTARSSAVSLMKSENVGEKPPKDNRFVAILGILILAGAYVLAVIIRNPLSALLGFFVAVLMVILATYLLMISGSVRLCRFLQGRKGYYYQAKHFVSVSSMAYRMKRNGAGLASICIIATMILVMLSTTTCMWFGADDSLRVSYPREIDTTVYLKDPKDLSDTNLDPVREEIGRFVRENGGQTDNLLDMPSVILNGLPQAGGVLKCDAESTVGNVMNPDRLSVSLFSPERYPDSVGELPALQADEAVLLTDGVDWKEDSLTLEVAGVRHTWKLLSVRKNKETSAAPDRTGNKGLCLIVPDLSAAVEGFETTNASGNMNYRILWNYHFDTGLTDEENIRIEQELEKDISAFMASLPEAAGYRTLWVDSRAGGAGDFYGTYGSLFFIGILLSIVFLLAAVLIIYYKQISEGYEDAKRFDIMQKVGMTKRDIRSSIRSQLLTVFALPLAFAGLHLIFAFPMIRRVLTLFSLYNVGLFIRTTVISFVAFALFYALIYRLTSGVYYRIVSGAESR